MSINQAIQIYLQWKQTHTTSAHDPYQKRLAQFAAFIGSEAPLKTISGDDIIAFHHSLTQTYSHNTIAYSARVLKNFFWFWHGRGATTFNPKEIIPIRFISTEKAIVTPEDMEDLTGLLRADTLADLQKKLVIHLLWDTGMRLSELLDIKLSDLGKEKNGLRSAKVRTRKSMRYNLVIWGKTTDDLLNNYLGIRLCMDTSSDYLLINQRTGKRFSPRSIQRWIKQLSNLAMLDKEITPHSFRHGKANHILDRGGNVRDVSAILRHVNPESSFQYLQLCQKRYLDVASKYLHTFSNDLQDCCSELLSKRENGQLQCV